MRTQTIFLEKDVGMRGSGPAFQAVDTKNLHSVIEKKAT